MAKSKTTEKKVRTIGVLTSGGDAPGMLHFSITFSVFQYSFPRFSHSPEENFRGGDAPGMNAAIRAVVRTALANGLKVKGIRRGYTGLLEEDIIDMNARSVADIIQRDASCRSSFLPGYFR